ncbi:iron complex transport system substrate-binding protein [Balnearium lithotrophicum]|uniref:Iron complex transport system substrate-binding protein n=1 Tax=Balnearium lithotrophicum TaxID=223788 RepID=A0A521BPU7_9BACT|nr:iron ABC transporter substrate-binding protein [Balnearium lithotrophicum]SMO48580.1 iron complex transport system substrate-binding protein [Balnearium lithotrophicum]
MKFLKFLFLCLLVLSFGCSYSGKNKGRVIVDYDGRRVTVPEKVERIVCCGPGALRLITYLEATDRVVGIENFERRHMKGKPYILAHTELLKLPSIGEGGPGRLPNYEALLKLKPDVIFITYVSRSTADELQKKTGIPVVVLSYGKLATFDEKAVFKSLRIAAKVLGKERREEEIEKFILQIENDLRQRSRKPIKYTVYVGGVSAKGTHVIESTVADYPPFKFLNLKNVASSTGLKGYLVVTKEQLLSWNPDFIFIDVGGLNIIKEDYKRHKSFYNSLKAFKTGNVYGLLPYNFYATNIGTALADAYYIGKVLRPDEFKDINIADKTNEITKFLVGKPLFKELRENWKEGFQRLEF